MTTRFLLLLALLFGAATWSATASAQAGAGVARWQHYGADHAYTTKAAAVADADRVFTRAGWPPAAARAMAQHMRSTQPERIELRRGDRLDFMRSGPGALWRNVLVDFRDVDRGVSVVAHADRWTLTIDGVTYEAILPDVCNNLAGRRSGTPEPDCVYVDVEIRQTDETRIHYGAVDNECFAVRRTDSLYQTDDGRGWTKPAEGCIGAPCDFSRVEAIVGQQMPRVGSVPVTPGRYQFRVRRGDLLILCLEYMGNGRRESSFSSIVRWQAYRQVGQQWHARVHYVSSDMPEGTTIGSPQGLFWWAENQQVADNVYALYRGR